MTTFSLQTNDLVHQFSGGETIVKKINLKVPQGSIYGFLGPNGAGKTTTLRLILGLLKKQQGDITFFGMPLNNQNRITILKKIGSLIESPSIYGHLTAYENLRLLQKIYQCPKSRIEEVLKMVDLDNTGNKKAGNFSLGMKQRLSIAIAMLNNPELLILDEPTNGLDPNGIIDIRELLKKLNRDFGTTIIISSHLLAEIEKLVTDVGIINHGEMMFQGTLNELKNKQLETASLLLETSNTAKTLQIITQQHLASEIRHGKIHVTISDKDKIAALNQQLVNHGIDVYEMSLIKNDLENIFMNLINN